MSAEQHTETQFLRDGEWLPHAMIRRDEIGRVKFRNRIIVTTVHVGEWRQGRGPGAAPIVPPAATQTRSHREVIADTLMQHATFGASCSCGASLPATRLDTRQWQAAHVAEQVEVALGADLL